MESENGKPEDYKVGYGKPPKATRFKKGQSGNPKGRPKNKRAEEIDALKILEEPVTATQNGRATKMQPFEAMLRQHVAKAVNGNLSSIKRVIKIFREHGILSEAITRSTGGVVVVPSQIEFDDFFALAKAEGISPHELSHRLLAERDEDRLRRGLEPDNNYRRRMQKSSEIENQNLNPGRPGGAKNHKIIVAEIANERFTGTQNDKKVSRTCLELVLLSLRNRALKGDSVQAFDEFRKLCDFLCPSAGDDGLGYIVVPEGLGWDEWVSSLEELDATRPERPSMSID